MAETQAPLVMAIIMMAGLIILAGCGGGEITPSGTSGGGAYDQSASSASMKTR